MGREKMYNGHTPHFVALYIRSYLLVYKQVHSISLMQGFHFLAATAMRPSFSSDAGGERKDSNILVT